MFIEGKSYRNTIVLIDNSEFLQYFVRLGVKSTMDFTFLNRAYSALRATTIDTMTTMMIVGPLLVPHHLTTMTTHTRSV